MEAYCGICDHVFDANYPRSLCPTICGPCFEDYRERQFAGYLEIIDSHGRTITLSVDRLFIERLGVMFLPDSFSGTINPEEIISLGL